METKLDYRIIAVYAVPFSLLTCSVMFFYIRGFSYSTALIVFLYATFTTVILTYLARRLFVFNMTKHGFLAYSIYESRWFFEWCEVKDIREITIFGEKWLRIKSETNTTHFCPSYAPIIDTITSNNTPAKCGVVS